MLAALLCGAVNDRAEAVTAAMFNGAQDGVSLVLSLLGAMCLWSGFMRIADKAGITNALAKAFSPLLRLLFPGVACNSAAAKAISMNVSANLLGMGNAATPFGLSAMQALAKDMPSDETASDAMITFVVLNTACFQLIPSTVAVLREHAGSAAPFEILPAVWITSIITLVSGLLAAWVLRGAEKSTVALQKRVPHRLEGEK